MAPFSSVVCVDRRRLREAIEFYENGLNFQCILNVHGVALLLVEGNSLTIRAEEVRREAYASLEVENGKKSIARAVLAGAVAHGVGFLPESFLQRTGQILNPFGCIWTLYERKPLGFRCLKIGMGLVAAAGLYFGVWKPFLQPMRPILHRGMNVAKRFIELKDELKNLDDKAEKKFAEFLPNMDPSSSSNWYSFD